MVEGFFKVVPGLGFLEVVAGEPFEASDPEDKSAVEFDVAEEAEAGAEFKEARASTI